MTTSARNNKSWLETEDQYIRDNWRKKSDLEMAEYLERRENGVKGRRAILGLVSVKRRNLRPVATASVVPPLPGEQKPQPQEVQVITPQGLPNFHKLPTMIVVDLANEPISAANRLSDLLTQNNFKFAAM